jgi:hypothetical protein
MDDLMTLTDADTQIRFDRPGVVLFSYHQDINHNCGYLWGQALINHVRSGVSIISRELISHTRGRVCLPARPLFGSTFSALSPIAHPIYFSLSSPPCLDRRLAGWRLCIS